MAVMTTMSRYKLFLREIKFVANSQEKVLNMDKEGAPGKGPCCLGASLTRRIIVDFGSIATAFAAKLTEQ